MMYSVYCFGQQNCACELDQVCSNYSHLFGSRRDKCLVHVEVSIRRDRLAVPTHISAVGTYAITFDSRILSNRAAACDITSGLNLLLPHGKRSEDMCVLPCRSDASAATLLGTAE